MFFFVFFIVLWHGLSTYLSFRFLLFLLCGLPRWLSPLFGWFSFYFLFFILLALGLVVWPRLDNLFVSQNPRELCLSHSPGQILGCAYTTCLYGQISISCTIPSGSPSSHVWFFYSFCVNLLHLLIKLF